MSYFTLRNLIMFLYSHMKHMPTQNETNKVQSNRKSQMGKKQNKKIILLTVNFLKSPCLQGRWEKSNHKLWKMLWSGWVLSPICVTNTYPVCHDFRCNALSLFQRQRQLYSDTLDVYGFSTSTPRNKSVFTLLMCKEISVGSKGKTGFEAEALVYWYNLRKIPVTYSKNVAATAVK